MALGTDVNRVVVVGGGIAGLAAALRLERTSPDTEVVLVESRPRIGGTILTEEVSGFLIEGGPDSFLARKPRGIGLCEELGLTCELITRVARHRRTYVRLGGELRALPEGLTGMIPTRLEALASSGILSPEGLVRFALEPVVPASPEAGDESIADFVSRRMGREAYERLVEPLMSGIYAGDGEQLSLAATFPNLRQLEREYGSVTRGLLEGGSDDPAAGPPFLSLRGGMRDLVTGLADSLVSTRLVTGRAVASLRRAADGHGYVLDLADGDTLAAGAVVLATPAYVTAALVASLDPQLAEAHAEIPYASTAIVTLAYPSEVLSRPLDGYGYVVPRIEGSDVLACTWTSSKWPGRAPEAHALVRVYMGRFGRRDVTVDSDEELVASARREIAATLAPNTGPAIARVHRWPRGMPQYVMGSLERLGPDRAPPARAPGPRRRRGGLPRSRHTRLHCLGRAGRGDGPRKPARAGARELSALRLGTRSSRLALAQAHMAAAALRELGHEVAIVPLSTQGDRDARRTFAEIGGRGIFASELEEALCDGRIDVAVHSAKDLTGEDVDGLSLAACLERADPRDAWVGPARSWDEVPVGARVATASIRRVSQLLRIRPDLQIEPVRGNVETRLRKRAERGLDAVILAAAGLDRLALAEQIGFRIEPGDMPPESGQGIVVLQVRAGEEALVAGADHADSSLALHAERAVTRALAGGCTVPVAAHAARLADGRWRMLAFADRDGSISIEQAEGGDPLALADPVLAAILGRGLRDRRPRARVLLPLSVVAGAARRKAWTIALRSLR